MDQTGTHVFGRRIRPMGWQLAWASDTGRVRSHNEDSFACHPGLGLLLVADGLGGYSGGEVASAIAVSAIVDEFKGGAGSSSWCTDPLADGVSPTVARAHAAVAGANRQILEAARQLPRYAGMGSTVVLAWFHDRSVTIASVGDSRLYRLRGHELQQLTVDHTVVQEQIVRGWVSPQQARGHMGRGMLTRALGAEAEVSADVFEQTVEPGDLYLLCSDGLFDMLEDGEICDILTALADDLEQAAAELVRRANDRGGLDNITLILAQATGDC